MLLVKSHIERDGSGYVTLRRKASSFLAFSLAQTDPFSVHAAPTQPRMTKTCGMRTMSSQRETS